MKSVSNSLMQPHSSFCAQIQNFVYLHAPLLGKLTLLLPFAFPSMICVSVTMHEDDCGFVFSVKTQQMTCVDVCDVESDRIKRL